MSLNSRGTVRDLQEIPKDQEEAHTPSPLKGLEASGGDKAQTSEDSKTNQSQQVQTGKSDTGGGGGTESPRCWHTEQISLDNFNKNHALIFCSENSHKNCTPQGLPWWSSG